MSKKTILYLLFFFSLFCSGQTQKIATLEQIRYVLDADDFVGVDGFGNFFYIKNNALLKYTEKGTLHYQNIALGKIKKVDIINPLKVVLFYEEFNTVVLLDNQMNEIQKIEFSKNETPIIASAIGMSGQNQLWIYNSIDQQIGLLDITTNQYKNLGVPIKENLLFYQTDFNYFHWIDKQNQWFSCSVFGRTINNGAMEYLGQMQFLEQNQILYTKETDLFLLDRNSSIHYKIEIVEKSFEKFYYKDQILSIFTPNEITTYKITLP